jgi:Sec-independent protein translocase protein TatA
MFETSWGEIFVMTGLCMVLIGRKDLPNASRFVGSQVGRVVGLLQGARMRADRFAAQNELRQLQNELRAGLRELDAVKAEIAVAASSRGTLGRQLGATVASVNRMAPTSSENDGDAIEYNYAAASENTTSIARPSNIPSEAIRPLAPRSQAVAAVAQDEWEKQGIGFTSRAEQRGSETAAGPSGAKILANLIQQSLIFDQHDRVVQEQQQALQSKMNDAQQHQKERKG